jgi:TolB-like protein
VLPFTNLSGDPNQEYFADGITEDLTSDLSRLVGRFVISRNTAFTFKGKVVDARQVGREHGVRYVLEGSVRRMGRTVRVNARLVDASTGAHLWAEQVDADQRALATAQDNFGIASRLARALSVELVNVEGRRAPRANPDAVDLVMRGWSLLNAGPNREDVENAVVLFEAALRIDPDNFQANVGSRATAVAPDSAQAQSVKAEILGLQNRFDAALATYDRAIALDRNLTTAHVGRARHLIVAGRAADAVASVERAIRLSPRDPDLISGTKSSATPTRTWRRTPRRSSGVSNRSAPARCSGMCGSIRLGVRMARPDRRGRGCGDGNPQVETGVERAADGRGSAGALGQCDVPQGVPANRRGRTQGGIAREMIRADPHVRTRADPTK